MRNELAVLGLLCCLSAAAAAQTAPQPAAGMPKALAPDADGTSTVQAHKVTIVNGSARRIETVKISSSKAADFGDDLLGNDEIDPKGTGHVSYSGPCRADLYIGFEGGASEARRFMDVCKTSTVTITPGWTLDPKLSADAS